MIQQLKMNSTAQSAQVEKLHLLRYRIGILLLGMSAGLCLVLTGYLLNFKLAKEGFSNAKISLFAVLELPYCINFLWAPLLDRTRVPLLSSVLGHSLAWALVLQLVLCLAAYGISSSLASSDLGSVTICAFAVTFIGATQNNIFGAIRSYLTESENGPSSGFYILGYRIGMLVAKSAGVYLALYLGWASVYQIFAVVLMMLGICFSLLLHGIKQQAEEIAPAKAFVNLAESSFSKTALLLFFLVSYRLADDLISVMLNPFLLSKGFQDMELVFYGTFVAGISVAFGGLFGGYLLKNLGNMKGLFIYGALHSFSHLTLLFLSCVGKNLVLYVFATLCESFTGGMAMAAYISFITSLSTGKYRVTQQALFSSMMGVSRVVFASVAGLLADTFGWQIFFTLGFVLNAFSLILLLKLDASLSKLRSEQA